MPRNPSQFAMQERFTGLDAVHPAHLIADTDVAACTNLYPYADRLYSRLGKVACFKTVPSANPNYAAIEFERSDGTATIVFVNNGKLYHTVPGALPMAFSEILIGGTVSFTLTSANVRMWRTGKYLYLVDGVGSEYRVNINADNTYTAAAVTALTPPSTPSAVALTYTTIDAMSSTANWTSDYLTPPGASKTITGATNATPIVVTSTSHGYSNGDIVYITGVVGNLAANGVWKVASTAANTFSLTYLDGSNSAGSGAWASGGTAQKVGGGFNLLPQNGYFYSGNFGTAGFGWTADNLDGTIDLTFGTMASASGTTVNMVQLDDRGDEFHTTTVIPNTPLGNAPARYARHFAIKLWMQTSYTTDSVDVTVYAYSDTSGSNLVATRLVNLTAKSTGAPQWCTDIVSFADLDTEIKSFAVYIRAGQANHAGAGPYITGLSCTPIVGNGTTSDPSATLNTTAGLLSVNVAQSDGDLPKLDIPLGGWRLTKDYIASGAAAKTITAATNASPIVVTSVAHGYSNGDVVIIHDVTGNTAANGVWTVANKATDTFELSGSTGNGAYVSGGTAIKAGVLDFSVYSHTALVIRPISPQTGLRYRIGLTNVTGTAFTNEATVQTDGITYAIDISSLTSAQLSNVAQLSIAFIGDLALDSDSGALFSLGPFTSAGNFDVPSPVDYNYVDVEAQDTSLDTSGASTGVTTDGTVLSDPSGPTAPGLAPTIVYAQAAMTLAAWTNSAANYRYIYRYGGPLSAQATAFTNYFLVAKLPRWTGGTNSATGWTWNGTTGAWTSTDGYCTWNPTTRAFTDNTPDQALIGVDVLVRGRTAPPTGATAVCSYANRNVLAKDSTLIISNLLTTDAAAGLYFPATVDPEDPSAVIKGARIPIYANSGNTIKAIVPIGQYLVVLKEQTLHVLTGLDPVDGFQVADHFVGKGIGLVAPRAWTIVNDHLVFLGPNAVFEYIGGERADKLSLKIEPLISPQQNGATAISASAYANAAMGYAQQRIWLFMPVAGGSSNSVAYMLDTRPSVDNLPHGWAKFTNYAVTGMVSLSGSNDTDDVYFTGLNGQFYKYTGNYDVDTLAAISAATNATPIAITATAHGLSSGDCVYVTGVGGNTAANGTWYATVADANTFSLYSDSARTVGVAGNGAYTSSTGAAGKVTPIPWTFTSKGFLQGPGYGFFTANRPTRVYANLDVAESTAVTIAVGAVGCASTSSKTYTVNGSNVDITDAVSRDVRGGAVQVTISGSSYAQVAITAVGVRGMEGTPRGNN